MELELLLDPSLDELRMTLVDELRMTLVDELRMTLVDELRMTLVDEDYSITSPELPL